MNKAQLIAAVAQKSGLTTEDAGKALAAFTETVEEALVSGERVQLPGFGTFEAVWRPERDGRNPATGESIRIPESRSPKFKPGRALKAALKENQ